MLIMKSPARVQVPKVGGNMECPYPTATFEYIKGALMGGGHGCTMFVYPERALANLVGAAWRDATWNRILVVCSTRRMVEVLLRCLKGVLKEMNMVDKIVKCNVDEMIMLVDGKELRAVTADPKYLRGVECDQLIFVRTDPMLVLPVWEHCREIYRLDVAFIEYNVLRRRESSQQGPWNATLQLVSISLER